MSQTNFHSTKRSPPLTKNTFNSQSYQTNNNSSSKDNHFKEIFFQDYNKKNNDAQLEYPKYSSALSKTDQKNVVNIGDKLKEQNKDNQAAGHIFVTEYVNNANLEDCAEMNSHDL